MVDRLRTLPACDYGKSNASGKPVEFINLHQVFAVLGFSDPVLAKDFSPAVPRADVDYVAWLIDRSKCHNVYDDAAMGSCENGFECSECGELVEDAEHYYVTGKWNYCPGCGREVIGGREQQES